MNFVHFDTLAFDSPGQCEWRTNTDGTRYKVMRLFNDTGAALIAGGVYLIVYDGDEEKNPKVVTCAATATLLQNVAIATQATADQTWDWLVVEGYYDALCNGDTLDLTKDDFLKIVVTTDADAFIDNTTSRTINSSAIYCDPLDETDATATRRRVFLFPQGAVIT